MRFGHRRSERSTGGNGRYFVAGFFNMALSLLIDVKKRNPTASWQWGSWKFEADQNPTAALLSSSTFASSRFKLRFTAGKIAATLPRVNGFLDVAPSQQSAANPGH